MYPRRLEKKITALARQYPVITVTGPRQSGKSTLIRTVFRDLPYSNLESSREREFASSDPIGYLAQFPNGAVIDEIQKVPELLSDIQVIVDEKRQNGLFILSGSENLTLSESIGQSLAGRTVILKLLPLSINECQPFPLSPKGIDDYLFTGFYPRIYAEKLSPAEAYSAYVETYIERDVRNLLNIRDLAKFRRFVELCAGRVGQLLNKNTLASEVGISNSTIEHWLSILEATFICYRLQPWHANIGKRLVKAPKLYFYDVGLAANLIGIDSLNQVNTHPLRGALFENLQIGECLKLLRHENRHNRVYFYRDSHGNEVDLLIQKGPQFIPIEIKSSQTFHPSFEKGIHQLKKLGLNLCNQAVVIGSHEGQTRSDLAVVPWDGLDRYLSGVLPSTLD